MPPRSVLLLRSTLPPMLLAATPWYEDRKLRQLANIPYEFQPIRPELPAAPQEPAPARMAPEQGASEATEPTGAEAANTANQEFFL